MFLCWCRWSWLAESKRRLASFSIRLLSSRTPFDLKRISRVDFKILSHHTSDFWNVLLRESHDFEASFDLLSDQGLGWRHEHDFSFRKPPIEVVHDNGSDKSLSETWTRYLMEWLLCWNKVISMGSNIWIIHRPVGNETRVFLNKARRTTENW